MNNLGAVLACGHQVIEDPPDRGLYDRSVSQLFLNPSRIDPQRGGLALLGTVVSRLVHLTRCPHRLLRIIAQPGTDGVRNGSDPILCVTRLQHPIVILEGNQSFDDLPCALHIGVNAAGHTPRRVQGGTQRPTVFHRQRRC